MSWFNENRSLLNEYSKIDRNLRTNDCVESIIKVINSNYIYIYIY